MLYYYYYYYYIQQLQLLQTQHPTVYSTILYPTNHSHPLSKLTWKCKIILRRDCDWPASVGWIQSAHPLMDMCNYPACHYLLLVMKNSLMTMHLQSADASSAELTDLCKHNKTVTPQQNTYWKWKILHTIQTHSRVVPWTKTQLVDRSFTVTGPRVWNMLPALLHLVNYYPHFRCQFKRTFV